MLAMIAAVGIILTFAGYVTAAPNGPKTGDIWICPSVSTNNPNGMWVIGGSGAYYIVKPGTASPNWPDILNSTGNLEQHAPRVENQAQIPAGWGLYSDLPSYPYLDTGNGYAVVLDDGADFIYENFGITIEPMAMVHVMPAEAPAFDGTTLYANVPLKSAAFW